MVKSNQIRTEENTTYNTIGIWNSQKWKPRIELSVYEWFATRMSKAFNTQIIEFPADGENQTVYPQAKTKEDEAFPKT